MLQNSAGVHNCLLNVPRNNTCGSSNRPPTIPCATSAGSCFLSFLRHCNAVQCRVHCAVSHLCIKIMAERLCNIVTQYEELLRGMPSGPRLSYRRRMLRDNGGPNRLFFTMNFVDSYTGARQKHNWMHVASSDAAGWRCSEPVNFHVSISSIPTLECPQTQFSAQGITWRFSSSNTAVGRTMSFTSRT
jgi:hypothetical protein